MSFHKQDLWWGLAIDINLPLSDILFDVEQFLSSIDGIPLREKAVWKLALSDIIIDNKPDEKINSFMVRKRPCSKWVAYFVSGRQRLLFLDWLLTHNRFKQIDKRWRNKVFDSWKENKWNDYCMSVTAGNTKELMTPQLRVKMQEHYIRLMNTTQKDLQREFYTRFHRLGVDQFSSDNLDTFPKNKLVTPTKQSPDSNSIVRCLRKSRSNNQKGISTNNQTEQSQQWTTSLDFVELNHSIII